MRQIKLVRDWGCYSAGATFYLGCLAMLDTPIGDTLLENGWAEEIVDAPIDRVAAIESKLDAILKILARSD